MGVIKATEVGVGVNVAGCGLPILGVGEGARLINGVNLISGCGEAVIAGRVAVLGRVTGGGMGSQTGMGGGETAARNGNTRNNPILVKPCARVTPRIEFVFSTTYPK